ncbi:unnamed protein product, partial [marine sediment metagenome]
TIPSFLQLLKPIHYPHHFVFFDTETLPFKIDKSTQEHKLRLGVALEWIYEGNFKKKVEQWFNFKTPDEFWAFIISKNYKKERLVVIAHNLQYDMRIVNGFEQLKKRGYRLG